MIEEEANDSSAYKLPAILNNVRTIQHALHADIIEGDLIRDVVEYRDDSVSPNQSHNQQED